jgi:hypothetical protein
MANALKIAPPPPRPAARQDLTPPYEQEPEIAAAAEPAAPPPPPPAAKKPTSRPTTVTVKFRQEKQDARVQFNKRIPRHVADGFELLAIRQRRKMPELLAEALELLEQRYGQVG